MKLIGLLGGMSAESTITYYQQLNFLYRQEFGNLGSCPLVIWSIDFQPLAEAQAHNDWEKGFEILRLPAQALEKAGAQCLVISSNLMHKVASQLASSCTIPLLHMIDAVGTHLKKRKIQSVCLLGARPTMEENFYREKLESEHNITSSIPDVSDREFVHSFIFNELCCARISNQSILKFHNLLDRLIQKHQAVLLACTELQLAIQTYRQKDLCFDTTKIHAQYAFDWACLTH